MAQGKSYPVAEDDFRGSNICRGCLKRFGNGPCTVYNQEGTATRRQAGYCPVVNRYADWRTDKPVRENKKVHVGQGKTKAGGNR